MSDTLEAMLGQLTTPARNRYFYGKLLDVYHFELEQHYFNRKRWLLNRLSLGAGVMCGLPVAPSADGTHIQVGPGVALDSLGREVIVPSPSLPVDPRQPTDANGNPVGSPITGAGTVTLYLAYHPCETEQVPVLVGDCDTQQGCAASTVCERYLLQIVEEQEPATPIQAACGFPNIFEVADGALSNLQPQLIAFTTQASPTVSGSLSIPLAQITLPAAGTLTAADINQSVCPVVPTNDLLMELIVCLAEQSAASSGAGGAGSSAPQAGQSAAVQGARSLVGTTAALIEASGPALGPLTQVNKISWGHDSTLGFATFIKKGLTITFSDNISATSTNGRAWFQVDVETPGNPVGETDTGTIVVNRVLDASITINKKQVIFMPDSAFPSSGQPTLCRVRVLCDFLLDSQDRPVDGDFLGGALPSGDGVKGGVFESWFTLNPSTQTG